MKNSSLVAIGVLVMGVAWATGCGKRAQEDDGTFKVGIVFDIGGLGDKSFNDAAYRGLMRAKEKLAVTPRPCKWPKK